MVMMAARGVLAVTLHRLRSLNPRSVLRVARVSSTSMPLCARAQFASRSSVSTAYHNPRSQMLPANEICRTRVAFRIKKNPEAFGGY